MKQSNHQHPDTQTVADILRGAGIRPTRQRLVLGQLLFDGMDKHVTAEQLHAAANDRSQSIALATVYNTLHQFTAAGLLRHVVVDPSRIYFDTNVRAHHHFYDPDSGHLTDVPHENVRLTQLPAAPDGRIIDEVSVILRLR